MKKVLFLCVGNSCRSQMAEGFARHYGSGVLEAHSAGTMPASSISKTAIEVMAEKGIDISHHRPQQLDPAHLRDYDILVSMGCGVQDTCPVVYLKDFIDWGLDDPMGQSIRKYRPVRDEIEKRVLELVDAITL
jgi:arsenate reductase